MKTKCPSCGAVTSLDVLLAHDGARDALLAALKMPAPLGTLVVKYLGLFRPATRELTFDRVASLLNELLPMIQAGQIERNGRTWPAPMPYWIDAMEDMLGKRDRLQLPMKSHGYLLEIIAGMSNQMEAKKEEKQEQDRRQRAADDTAGGKARRHQAGSPPAAFLQLAAAITGRTAAAGGGAGNFEHARNSTLQALDAAQQATTEETGKS